MLQGEYNIANRNYHLAFFHPHMLFSLQSILQFETHSDMAVASRSDLQEADAQGTILLVNYRGVWYGNGTVGDAENLGNVDSSSAAYRSGYEAGYAAGWAKRIESSSRYYQMSDETMTYSAAGAASALLCGFGLVKAYKRVTGRRVALASEEGSRSPRPLIEIR